MSETIPYGGTTGNKCQSKWSISRKKRNKTVKCGNGNGPKSIKIAQWNLGSRMWQNKVDEIQLFVDEQQPDLAFITEYNLWEGVSDHLIGIDGYELLKPLTNSRLGYSRIIALIKENIKY